MVTFAIICYNMLMIYTKHYDSPLGELLLAADEVGLTGVWFDEDKYYGENIDTEHTERETPVLKEASRWLDIYFSGRNPGFTPPLHPVGTSFRMAVWKILLEIPYGTTTTYGEIARRIAADRGIDKMSAQAVGGAVGHNEISIIIPCHRVIGSDGSLTGYASGLDKKIGLLKLEHISI